MKSPFILLVFLLFAQVCYFQASAALIHSNQPSPKADFQCPETGGFFAIPGECSGNYYSCVQGVPYLLSCPGSSIFDPQVGVCVPAELASCSTSATSTTVGTSTTTGGSTTTPGSTTTKGPVPTAGPFTCPDQFGYYAVPDVPCSDQFWRCSNGIPYLMDCPDPTIYNPTLTVCDWPYNVPGCNIKTNYN